MLSLLLLSPASANALLLVNVRPVGTPHPTDVLIIDDRIAAIGDALAVPVDAQRLDLSGRTLAPSLIERIRNSRGVCRGG